MNQDFRVGASTEDVTTGFELPPHVEMVVQFAVEDHPDSLILIGHRLCAAFDIHDAQTSMAET